MGYNVAGLPAYVDQTGALLRKSVFGAKSASILGKQPGVKGSASVNIFDDASTFQSDACGFNSIDSTTLTQRTLVVGAIKVDKKWCPGVELDGKYAQYLLKPGSYQDEIPFEQELMGLVADTIAAQLETAIWTGDLASGNANLNKFDGLIKVISGATGVISGATGSITTSNIIATVDAVYAAIPVAVLAKPDLRILMGFDTYRTYTTALKNANLYHYEVEAGTDFEFILPGTNVKVVALNGLNATSTIVAARLSNLVYGFDLENDSAEAKIWFSMDNQEVRSTIKFKAGTQIAFPTEIVYYH